MKDFELRGIVLKFLYDHRRDPFDNANVSEAEKKQARSLLINLLESKAAAAVLVELGTSTQSLSPGTKLKA